MVVCGRDGDAPWTADLVIVGGACEFVSLLAGLAGFRLLGDVVAIFFERLSFVMEFRAAVW